MALITAFLMTGCKSAPAPTPAPSISTVAKASYPPRPTVTPPPFRVFHTTDNSITLVTDANATDDQVAAILWQLHDAAHNNTFAALHVPQQLVDKRDPMVWFHVYRGDKCASEKYTTGKLPCGPSYHAAGDYTLGSFSNKDRDDAVLLHADDKQTELWNPDAPYTPPPSPLSVGQAKQLLNKGENRPISVVGHFWFGKEGSMIYDDGYKTILPICFSQDFDARHPYAQTFGPDSGHKGNIAVVRGQPSKTLKGRPCLEINDISFHS